MSEVIKEWQDKLDIYNDNWREELAGDHTEDWLVQAYDEADAESLLDRTLYVDHVTYLSGDLLPKSDRMTMAHSVEARAPFLDPEWVEWTARLPEKYKVRGMQTKWLLKSAFQDEIPARIRSRGKQGFSIPVGHWMRYELKDWSRQLMMENKFILETFNSIAIEKLINEHSTGRVNHGKKLWALLMVAIWDGNNYT